MTQAKVGDRVKLLHLAENDSTLVRRGDKGTVDLIDDSGTVHVRWDKGVSLGLIPGVDRWETLLAGGVDK